MNSLPHFLDQFTQNTHNTTHDQAFELSSLAFKTPTTLPTPSVTSCEPLQAISNHLHQLHPPPPSRHLTLKFSAKTPKSIRFASKLPKYYQTPQRSYSNSSKFSPTILGIFDEPHHYPKPQNWTQHSSLILLIHTPSCPIKNSISRGKAQG